ncbi:killer cell lectin-like receptor subfamily B member 1B allele A [Alligator sinensis]|uniref:Killer cell lectin-like receptor subfamily B member 1B allele A n=1 Tax=Alligator sinensis TaxID=38654 RepID=A0A3Q0FW84_ALLSI|nr:killer cell lectin-like receptor subfamily B member 1B allele A [Alligator sinensis]
MAEDIIYADLNLPGAKLPCPSRPHASPECPRWHQLFWKIGVAGYVTLLGIIVVLTLQVLQEPSAAGAASQACAGCGLMQGGSQSICNASQLENLVSDLRRVLCEPGQGSSAESSQCIFCPREWLLHKGKCYWVSKENKMWNSSSDDCMRRRSLLLVIQNQEEMGYIQTITQVINPIWIGLHFKSPERKWIWMNGSLLDEKLFPMQQGGDRNCGVLKRDQTDSETCSTELRWICQKAALLV